MELSRWEEWANTLAVLAMRKARSPAWSCMHVCAFADMHEKNKCKNPCEAGCHLLRVCLCVL